MLALLASPPARAGDTAAPPFTTDAQTAKKVMDAEMAFEQFVFAGPRFPSCDFKQPVAAMIGPYKIEVSYYNSRFKKVKGAAAPGRYGAIVKVVPQNARPFYRFFTLFRPPTTRQWQTLERQFATKTLAQLRAQATAVARRSPKHAEKIRKFADDIESGHGRAILLAGLNEARLRNAKVDIHPADRQWWVTMKRIFYRLDKKYIKKFLCPRPKKGKPAKVIRDGTLEEAGMKPGAAKQIDGVLSAWADDSGEPFAVCIVRHGVIVLHKAYGLRGGKPMTLTTRSAMASITKLLSATLMMMLVDRGVDLDAPVEKYLPVFGDIEVRAPLTIRHLYTHTSGLWDHWGDNLNDFEQRLAVYYPHLEVGKRHLYNGAGYALGGKIIEALTGESIPNFYKKHLLEPLACTGTTVVDTYGGATSTPMDIARIAQMLLNRGSYGNMMFFREKTFEKMLPVSLKEELGVDTDVEWGIGTTWFRGEGLGKGTFGHGAASGVTLRIDPENDLVIVMTRNKRGKNFADHHANFLRAVADGIKKD
ncbi:MAG: serine hydrolase domain-containing protein [Phycisphaerae bacterium]|nr:serine hydrolase domain-containing protein [Phycisphaerae bacterium]